MRITGLDKLQRKFDTLAKNAEELASTQTVPMSEILNDAFLQRHTRFQTLQQMVDASGIQNADEIHAAAWSEFVGANSDFESWDAMYSAAAAQYLSNKLGF